MPCLAHAQLSGQLPDSLGALAQLHTLALNDNAFSGTVSTREACLRGQQGCSSRACGGVCLLSSWPAPVPVSNMVARRDATQPNTARKNTQVPASWGSLSALTSPFLYNNSQLGGCLPPSWASRLSGSTGTAAAASVAAASAARAAAPGETAVSFDATMFLLGGTQLTGFCGSSGTTSGARTAAAA